MVREDTAAHAAPTATAPKKRAASRAKRPMGAVQVIQSSSSVRSRTAPVSAEVTNLA